MIINRFDAAFEYEGVTYKIGDPIIGTPESEYDGLFGTITEIRDGEDKETENETPDIYCCFEPPVLPYDIQQLEQRFSELYQQPKKVADIVLDFVIMAPEMIESLRNQREGKQELKVYAVCEDWSVDCEGGSSISLFTDLRDAKRELHNLLQEEMENGCIPNWADRCNFTCESDEDSYECYLDGTYCENHYKIYVRTELVLISDAVLGSLGRAYIDQCRLEDFVSQVSDWDELVQLTDEQYARMIRDPRFPERLEKALGRNDSYWESYWETVSEVAREFVNAYLKENAHSVTKETEEA